MPASRARNARLKGRRYNSTSPARACNAQQRDAALGDGTSKDHFGVKDFLALGRSVNFGDCSVLRLRGVDALTMPALEAHANGALLRGQNDLALAREPADGPVEQRRRGLHIFFQLCHRHFTVGFERVPDGSRHSADFFTHWGVPLLSKFRVSRTSMELAATGARSRFCFL